MGRHEDEEGSLHVPSSSSSSTEPPLPNKSFRIDEDSFAEVDDCEWERLPLLKSRNASARRWCHAVVAAAVLVRSKSEIPHRLEVRGIIVGALEEVRG